ncbi:MAG: NADAR family protein [Bacteroidota bacterium]|jgi:predicted NAD-dependent protein-ADP-ribosyltransferase YbiA (DUF1768 family)
MNYKDFLSELGHESTLILKKNVSLNCSENCTLELREGDEIAINNGSVSGKFGVKHRVEVQNGELSTESNLPPGVHYKVNENGVIQIPYYYENDSRYLGGFFKGNPELQPVYHDVLKISLYVEKPAASVKGKKTKTAKKKVEKSEAPAIPEGFIAFNKVAEAYGWMSNMAKYPIEKDGKKWICAEALFQALRFSNNPEIQQAISEQTNPMAVKFIAKKKTNIPLMSVKPTSDEDFNNLKQIISMKLSQNPALSNELLATGDKILFDNAFSKKDREPESLFWGGYIENGSLLGENKLGKIWMELRDSLKN